MVRPYAGCRTFVRGDARSTALAVCERSKAPRRAAGRLVAMETIEVDRA
jgi:hypothetical protein